MSHKRSDMYEETYRGISFARGRRGVWALEQAPSNGDACSRYFTDDEIGLLNDQLADVQQQAQVIRKGIDRMLAGLRVYTGDIPERAI